MRAPHSDPGSSTLKWARAVAMGSLAGLPGRDGHVGHPASLAPDLALGVGVTIMTGAQVIYREVDDFRQMWDAHEHQQMEHGGVLHEAGDHPAVQGRE